MFMNATRAGFDGTVSHIYDQSTGFARNRTIPESSTASVI